MSEEIKETEVEFNEDVFEAMLSGTFEEPQNEDEADVAEDFEEDDNEHQEDTDQEEESESDDETNQDGDGDAEDTYEDEEDDEEEDALVETGDSDDEGIDVSDEEEEADEASESEEGDSTKRSEDSADTEEKSDGDSPDTETVDYKAFYDAVTNAEFVVNGKKVKGFKDPQKIIQSQQMAGGFSEKMAGFKQYRPFMAPLKERGMLDDQAKFDLAMNLVDGDKEAIKLHLKSLNIDPLDLDMDVIDYSGKSTVASKEALVLEDVMERAKSAGIEDRVRQVVGKEWDTDSFNEFVTNPLVRNDLLTHIETGAYDMVQDKIAELSRLDYTGEYSSMNAIAKYREAARVLQSEQAANPAPVQKAQPATTPKANPEAVKKASVKAEKEKIEQARKEREYKAKAKEEESKRMAQRKKATSSSKGKAGSKPKAAFDPMKVEGEELDSLMDFLISGGR